MSFGGRTGTLVYCLVADGTVVEEHKFSARVQTTVTAMAWYVGSSSASAHVLALTPLSAGVLLGSCVHLFYCSREKKDSLLISGDSNGSLHLLSFKSQQPRSVPHPNPSHSEWAPLVRRASSP